MRAGDDGRQAGRNVNAKLCSAVVSCRVWTNFLFVLFLSFILSLALKILQVQKSAFICFFQSTDISLIHFYSLCLFFSTACLPSLISNNVMQWERDFLDLLYSFPSIA